MARRRHHSQQGQYSIAQMMCRLCNYATFDVDDYEFHRDIHMLQAAIGPNRQHIMMQTQLIQRSININPVYQFVPSSIQIGAIRGTSGVRINSQQVQRNNRANNGAAASGIRHMQGQLIQARPQRGRIGLEAEASALTRPLINQLDRPIPEIIDLVDEEEDESTQLDVTLRL